jgi:RNA polymerase sigma-70 factor (ECF subfamily)
MHPEVEQAAALLREQTPESVAKAIALLQRTVYGFSMKVCGHPEDAEDTMQEVLMRSAPHLARLQDANALAVWLYTVTRNRCWRMRRKPAGAPVRMLTWDELMPSESEMASLAARASSPEEAAILSEQQELVRRAVLEIPPQYRMVLVLHDMEDLEIAQIAQVLELKPGTVRVRLHRARLAVRKVMTAMLAGEELAAAAKATQTPLAESARKKHRSADCRKTFAQLSELLADSTRRSQETGLPQAECERVQRHLDACPKCVLFLRDLREAMERCQALEVGCDAQVGAALRSQLTSEYLRLLGESAA